MRPPQWEVKHALVVHVCVTVPVPAVVEDFKWPPIIKILQ